MKKIFPVKAKLHASFVHFLISLVIFLLLTAWVIFILYPKFYFNMGGGWQGLVLVFSVDVVLGPLLTFLVYNPAKKLREIVSDFVIIGIVQLAALIYGVQTLYQEHPKLLVIYEYGNATALTHREVLEDDALRSAWEKADLKVAGVRASLFKYENEQAKFVSPLQEPLLMQKADRLSREALVKAGDGAALQAFEEKHGQGLVLGAMGKYTGAYIILDKQNLSYMGKVGEKPL